MNDLVTSPLLREHCTSCQLRAESPRFRSESEALAFGFSSYCVIALERIKGPLVDTYLLDPRRWSRDRTTQGLASLRTLGFRGKAILDTIPCGARAFSLILYPSLSTLPSRSRCKASKVIVDLLPSQRYSCLLRVDGRSFPRSLGGSRDTWSLELQGLISSQKDERETSEICSRVSKFAKDSLSRTSSQIITLP